MATWFFNEPTTQEVDHGKLVAKCKCPHRISRLLRLGTTTPRTGGRLLEHT